MSIVIRIEYVAYLVAAYVVYRVIRLIASYLTNDAPKIKVAIAESELRGKHGAPRFDVKLLQTKPHVLHCWDPATMEYLGEMEPMTAPQVRSVIEAARVAQREWCKTSFAQRRRFLRTLQRFITENTETIAAGAASVATYNVCTFAHDLGV
jgi:hypothetical protein